MNKNLLIVSVILLLIGCSSKKNVLILQDMDDSTVYTNNYVSYKVKVDDILRIKMQINSELPELSSMINPDGQNYNLQNSKDALLYNGYQVDSNGEISVPSVGKIRVENLSLLQIQRLITETIVNLGILNDPIVDVKLLNANFTVLGEVLRPGKYDFLENNLNLLEALGYAGDLTINGDRKNIKLIRDIRGKKEVFNIDLTNDKILSDNNFQIFSGDIIIINPNYNKIKSAGIIGNSGTLLSLLSFVLSSIIVISN